MINEKIMIVVAHPDDEVLGCGGLLSKLKDKSKFRIVVIGEGSTCRKFQNNSQKKKAIKIRETQCLKAMNFFKIKDVRFYNKKCGKINSIPIIEINKIIEKNINEFKPSIIFTHSSNDLNQDHKTIFDSVMISSRPNIGNNFLKKIFSFEILSSTEWKFQNIFEPNYFLSLNKKNIMEKNKALSFYKSEINRKPYPRSLFGIESLANYRGLQSANEYAEAYKLVRCFIK